jgi:hypothetical protein
MPPSPKPLPGETRIVGRIPLHILEGSPLPWHRWFAWRPVRSEQGDWIWMRKTWRRRFLPPVWFIPPAPADGWNEYSDIRKSFWEEVSP